MGNFLSSCKRISRTPIKELNIPMHRQTYETIEHVVDPTIDDRHPTI